MVSSNLSLIPKGVSHWWPEVTNPWPEWQMEIYLWLTLSLSRYTPKQVNAENLSKKSNDEMVSIHYQSYYQRYRVTIDFQRFCTRISPECVCACVCAHVCVCERERKTHGHARLHARVHARMHVRVHAHTLTGSKINKHIEPIEGGGHQKLS